MTAVARPPSPGPRPTSACAVLGLAAVLAVGLAGLTGNPWLLLVTGALAGLLVTTGTSRTDLAGLAVQWSGPGRATSGDELVHHVVLTNGGGRALPAFRLVVHYPGLPDTRIQVPALPPAGQASTDLTYVAGRRGRYRGGDLQAEVTDPLRLVRRRHGFTMRLGLTVHPQTAEPVPAELSPAGDGAREVTARGADELAGLRPWRAGDEQRDVHWRASARRGRPVVVERDRPAGQQWVLAVVGAFRTAADELALSRVAATWTLVHAGQVPARVLTWAPTPAPPTPLPDVPPPAPGGSAQEVLDWCAAVDVLGVPGPLSLLDALPDGCTAVTVLATSTTPPGWLTALTSAATARGVRVVAVREAG
jgi:uncharacterized protein (DUF58 family)